MWCGRLLDFFQFHIPHLSRNTKPQKSPLKPRIGNDKLFETIFNRTLLVADQCCNNIDNEIWTNLEKLILLPIGNDQLRAKYEAL